MNRKLLYFNLAIDSKDTSLGFAIKWIETISNNYDQVDVVTLRLSTNPNFSNNVNVYGPKKLDKKIYKYYYFFKQVKFLTSNNEYERCFSHMSPISVLIASYYLIKKRIKTTLWFTHPGPKFGLKKIILFMSLLISEQVVTASKTSFPFKSKKVHVIGHAIDLNIFSQNKKNLSINKFLILSRISKSKNIHTTIDSFLNSQYKNYPLDIIGGPLNSDDNEYLKILTNKYNQPNINFVGKIDYESLPNRLKDYDVHINNAPSGFFDKSVLETLSSGIINLYKNDDFNKLFNNNNNFHFKSSENLIEKLNNLNQLKNDFGDLLEVLNNELQENSLLTLNKRISKYL